MKNKLINIANIIFIGLMLFSCKAFKEPSMHAGKTRKAIEVIIANHRVNCTGVAPQMCYLVKLNEEDEWQNYYNELEGFEYEEGYEYRVKVKVEPVSNS